MNATVYCRLLNQSKDTKGYSTPSSIFPSTPNAVLFTESIKLVICTIIHLYQTWSETRENQISQIKPPPILSELCTKMYRVASHSLPMSLPAGMFVMQQLLIIVAASHLDSVTFQIIIQACKLLPTALFAYYLLGQKLVRCASFAVFLSNKLLKTKKYKPLTLCCRLHYNGHLCQY